MQKRTLIIGSGPCAQNIAEGLLEKNVEIIIAAKDKKPVLIFSAHKKQRSPELLTQTRVLECRGSVGNFTVFMEQHGQKIERNAANIVIAEEDRRESTKEFKEGQRFRAGVEGTISVLKRAFKLDRCLFRGFKNYAASLGCAVFCHNLVLLARL